MSVLHRPDEDGFREVVLADVTVGYIKQAPNGWDAYSPKKEKVGFETSRGKASKILVNRVRGT